MVHGRTMKVLMGAAICLCLIAPGAAAQERTKPAWVAAKPADDETNMYFIGFGFSAKGNILEAKTFAAEDVSGQIVKFVGVRITSTTTVKAKGGLDEFTADITKDLTVTGSGRVSGFRPQDDWTEKTGGGLACYLLVSYEKESLLKEKKRLEELFQIIIDAVRIPEAEGVKLFDAGRYFEAALRRIEAAVAAAESTLEDRDIALNRNLAGAMAALEKCNLIKVNDNLTGTTGAEPAEAFKLKVSAGNSAADPGVSAAAVLVTYYTAMGSSPVAKTVSLHANDSGELEFRHPSLAYVGRGKVTMQLDLGAYLDKLKPAEKRAPEKVAALRKLALSKKQEFQVTALASAKNLPLVVFMVDLDDNGKPLPKNQSTASGITESLSQQGFKLKGAGLDAGLAGTLDDEALTELLRKKAPDAERAVVGTASVEGAEPDQGRYIVTASGTVKVIDLKTAKVIYEKSLQKKFVGSGLEAGKTGAFKALGRDMGLRIAADAK